MGRLSLLLSPFGRIGRALYWQSILAILFARLVLEFVPVVGSILSFLLIWPQLCVVGKRLHDLGRTAWWMVVPMAFGGLGFAMGFDDVTSIVRIYDYNPAWIAEALPHLLPGLIAFAAAAAVVLVFYLWLGLAPSQPESNRFGPPST